MEPDKRIDMIFFMFFTAPLPDQVCILLFEIIDNKKADCPLLNAQWKRPESDIKPFTHIEIRKPRKQCACGAFAWLFLTSDGPQYEWAVIVSGIKALIRVLRLSWNSQ